MLSIDAPLVAPPDDTSTVVIAEPSGDSTLVELLDADVGEVEWQDEAGHHEAGVE